MTTQILFNNKPHATPGYLRGVREDALSQLMAFQLILDLIGDSGNGTVQIFRTQHSGTSMVVQHHGGADIIDLKPTQKVEA